MSGPVWPILGYLFDGCWRHLVSRFRGSSPRRGTQPREVRGSVPCVVICVGVMTDWVWTEWRDMEMNHSNCCNKLFCVVRGDHGSCPNQLLLNWEDILNEKSVPVEIITVDGIVSVNDLQNELEDEWKVACSTNYWSFNFVLLLLYCVMLMHEYFMYNIFMCGWGRRELISGLWRTCGIAKSCVHWERRLHFVKLQHTCVVENMFVIVFC